jgi:hypothetical protein
MLATALLLDSGVLLRISHDFADGIVVLKARRIAVGESWA